MTYWTKHFDGFDVVFKQDGFYIVSETDPENKPLIGSFKSAAEAIEFGLNRVEKIKWKTSYQMLKLNGKWLFIK